MEPHSVSDAERRADYLRRAAEADANAIVAETPEIANTWRRIAQSWRFLAEQIEKGSADR